MARPREFDESAVLDAAVQCFWKQGYEATSVKDLTVHTGIAAASLYNAFWDKRSLYERSLERYVAETVADRSRRCEVLSPRRAIEEFFDGIVQCSLNDRDRKDCMLVNAAPNVAPYDPAFRKHVAKVLASIGTFFLTCVGAGQAGGIIMRFLPAENLARHLLGVLMGVRVLARIRPARASLKSAASPVLTRLRVGAEAG